MRVATEASSRPSDASIEISIYLFVSFWMCRSSKLVLKFVISRYHLAAFTLKPK